MGAQTVKGRKYSFSRESNLEPSNHRVDLTRNLCLRYRFQVVRICMREQYRKLENNGKFDERVENFDVDVHYFYFIYKQSCKAAKIGRIRKLPINKHFCIYLFLCLKLSAIVSPTCACTCIFEPEKWEISCIEIARHKVM